MEGAYTLGLKMSMQRKEASLREIWSKSVFISDGPIRKDGIHDVFKEARSTFQFKSQPFRTVVDYRVKRARTDLIDEERALLCREFANLLTLAMYDLADEVLERCDRVQELYKTANKRYDYRNTTLLTLARSIFTLTYFDSFTERSNQSIQTMHSKLKDHFYIYCISPGETRFHRRPDSPLIKLLRSFSEVHFRSSYYSTDIEHVEKLLLELEHQLTWLDARHSSSLKVNSSEYEPPKLQTDSTEAKLKGRVSPYKYNDRPLSEIRRSSVEEIRNFLDTSSNLIDAPPHLYPDLPIPSEIQETSELITAILRSEIRADITKRQRNEKMSLQKHEIDLLTDRACHLFYKHLCTFLYSGDFQQEALEIIKAVLLKFKECLPSNSDQNPDRYKAVRFRVCEAAHSWDLVELTSNLFADPETDRDYSRLMAVIWFEFQEALYRPLKIAFDPISFAKPSCRRKGFGSSAVIYSRSNGEVL